MMGMKSHLEKGLGLVYQLGRFLKLQYRDPVLYSGSRFNSRAGANTWSVVLLIGPLLFYQ
jgi:hypothetical protein